MAVNSYTSEAITRLPREDLRRMLAEELNKDPTKADDTRVRLLLAELQSRGNDFEFVDDDAVKTACEKFRTDTSKG